jgi:hypothetical protein
MNRDQIYSRAISVFVFGEAVIVPLSLGIRSLGSLILGHIAIGMVASVFGLVGRRWRLELTFPLRQVLMLWAIALPLVSFATLYLVSE